MCRRSRSLPTWLSAGSRRPLCALAKSKVVTGAPSYALAWTFFDPLHSCATVRALCCLLSPLLASVTVGARRPLGAPAKSKVVTGAPSYALSWTFPDPVHSCVSARRSLLASVTVGTRRSLCAPSKSKVVTRAPSYASAWTFFDLEHSCPAARALCWPGSHLACAGHTALQQKVECWGAHPLIQSVVLDVF